MFTSTTGTGPLKGESYRYSLPAGGNNFVLTFCVHTFLIKKRKKAVLSVKTIGLFSKACLVTDVGCNLRKVPVRVGF